MPPDAARLRATVEHLAAMERPSASPGERAAAEWIAARLREEGADARVETEAAHGTYWVPLGLLSGAAALAGLRAGRRLAAVVGLAAAAGIADDVSAGPHLFRRILKRRETANVVAEAGDVGAEETVVLVAHHDAAHGGFIFDPRFVTVVADAFPGWYERQETSAQVMQAVAGGPALVALGALTGLRPLRALGTLLAAGSAAAFADIARRDVVPGANDNLTAVAVLVEVARQLRERPVDGVRVLLVSTGSEESFMEGMRGFVRRHRAALDPGHTRVLCLESLGAPELVVIEGEGMLRVEDYPADMREELAAAGAAAGVPLRRGLRLGLATDGLIALRAGYRSATLAAITEYKVPANYHSPRDVPENVDFETVRRATLVCDALIRRAAPAPA
jgi:Peptidase family M28